MYLVHSELRHILGRGECLSGTNRKQQWRFSVWFYGAGQYTATAGSPPPVLLNAVVCLVLQMVYLCSQGTRMKSVWNEDGAVLCLFI